MTTTHICQHEIAPPSTASLTHKGLISEELWIRLTERLRKDEGFPAKGFLAERIMDQALGYLKLAATLPNGSFAPSALVDLGWHTFLMYTREYQNFCRELTGGYFIHHSPNDDPSVNSACASPSETATVMRSLGIEVDDALWTCFDHGCSNCGPCCGPSCSCSGNSLTP